MNLAGLLVFAAAYAVAVASPGPGIAAIVARVLARGTPGLPAFIAGFVAGDLIWFTIAATGLAILAQAFATLFVVIKYAGVAYLLWLAYRLWTAPVREAPAAAHPNLDCGARLFVASLLVSVGNPKVIVFFLALLPTVVDLATLSLVGFAEIAALIVAILSLVLGGYALAAARARRLFSSPRALRRINRGTGAVMAGVAAAIAAR